MHDSSIAVAQALAQAILLFAAGTLTNAAEALKTADPVVATSTGKISGYKNDDVYTFKGVPYGASTAGDARFKAPRPAAPWTDVREAKEPGCVCPQSADVGRRTVGDRRGGEIA